MIYLDIKWKENRMTFYLDNVFDDGNTMIYLRFYQNFLTLPLLGPLVTSLSNFYNKKILHQDRRVVLTQLPKETKLNMSENLIQGDLPIIEFRKEEKF